MTGLGTPIANLLVPGLATYQGAVSSQRSTTVTANDVADSGVNSAGGFSRTFNSDASIYALTLRVSYLFGPPVVTNY